jgi:hypothetical protein
LLLACFGDGLYRYDVGGPRQQRIPLDSPCHLASLSYAGDRFLTVEDDRRVRLRNPDGFRLDQIALDTPVVSLALGALADFGVFGLADGSIHRVDTRMDDRAAREGGKG